MSDGMGAGLQGLPVGIGVVLPRARRDSLRAGRNAAFHGKPVERIRIGTERVHGVRLKG